MKEVSTNAHVRKKRKEEIIGNRATNFFDGELANGRKFEVPPGSWIINDHQQLSKKVKYEKGKKSQRSEKT